MMELFAQNEMRVIYILLVRRFHNLMIPHAVCVRLLHCTYGCPVNAVEADGEVEVYLRSFFHCGSA